jgi:hypothetical protein
MTSHPQNGSTEVVRGGNENRKRLIAGIALIALGLLALLPQFVDLDNIALLFLPALALVFLAWGLATRTLGLIIPGGILAGIGLGVYLMTEPFADLGGAVQPGVFLLAFSAGWALISLLSLATDEGFQWWPLIPGGIIGLVGLFLMMGEAGLQVLQLIGLAWPVALIGLGIYILLRRR